MAIIYGEAWRSGTHFSSTLSTGLKTTSPLILRNLFRFLGSLRMRPPHDTEAIQTLSSSVLFEHKFDRNVSVDNYVE